MRVITLLALAGSIQAAEPDAGRLVRRALEIHEASWKAAAEYEHVERIRKIDLDRNGREKKLDIKSFRVLPLEGSPYKRMIGRFDEPLSPEEEESEQVKLERQAAQRGRESAKERAGRIRRHEKRLTQTSAAVKEIPDAFVFKLLGEEQIRGKTAYVIGVSPREGYKPPSMRARVFTQLHGKLWVDKDSGAWLKLKAELAGPVTFGWFLVRIHKGAKVEVENTRIGGEHWALERLWYRVSMRIGLVKSLAMDEEHRYRDYRMEDREPSL